MSEFVIYHMPGACSRVTINALEEIGVDYQDHVVNLAKGEQKTPEYLAINPKGKVPAFLVDGQLLTETPSILYYLHQRFPEAGLLPSATSDYDRSTQLSDLSWCSSTFHIMARQCRMPIRLTTGDPGGVRDSGLLQMSQTLPTLEQRFASQPYWYGDQWSIVDVYLQWCYNIGREGGADLTPYAFILEHEQRLSERPSFVRAEARLALARERAGLVA